MAPRVQLTHSSVHRLQFGGVPWLRGHLAGSVERYLTSVELDPRWLLDRLEHALKEVRAGGLDHRDLGWFALLMTEDQRDMVRRLQGLMSLLEGHATFVMDRFIARHINSESKKPEVPSSEPVMICTRLASTKPMAASAKPA